ncbi:tripartite tricarboxylate transporter substrate binding protein [Roseomonas alkaliterrae]|uniref:Tripartite-type tricarboxylate transporter receptor subunit TctC n=1 Tax=Neoroseomonas alkaliterrae TaxID=1452450 RepID=A0A840XJL6_9PROT|nr:tripartite tricarboxylate transporter substrate binding protein [Neoroseomonas alkaliterrae]MBB5688698.1 tripartite-type tricarboxylate transporter receptor subunit TctC [Neoroseomonas alkaliterrae]MBR0675227.1 tripartite tricarboxylate transporter substrate binding protein [Neoroseomonas alkaliterrae]
MNRRTLFGLGAAAALASRPAFAQAPAWPTGPVRMIVPFAAGGPTDVPARLLADQMSGFLPHRVVVENRTGSGVVVGTDVVAKAPKDGQTILYTTVGHAYLPGLFDRLPFDPVADFTPAAFIGQIPQILLVHKDFPAQTLPDLIRLLRENPGRFDYASSGNGGAVHLGTELFLHMAGGLKVNHIAFRGSSAALPEVLSGRVPMIFDVAASALPYIERNELRPLAISTRTRMPYAPNIPTFIEGGVADFECYTWHMAMVPSGTPMPTVRAINAAFNRALAIPAVQQRLQQLTMNVTTDSTPESAARFLASEMAKWTPVIRAAGIRPS